MSKIRLHGSSSGYTEIAPVAASGNNTLTLPDDGTILSKDSNGAVGVTSITVGTGVTIGDGRVTCTTVHGSAASLTSIPAANIVGVCTSGLTKTGGFSDYVKLQQNTGSSAVSELNFDDLDVTTYKHFDFIGALCPVNDAVSLRFRFRTGGSSGSNVTSAAYGYGFDVQYPDNNEQNTCEDDATKVIMTTGIGNDTGEGIYVNARITFAQSGDGTHTRYLMNTITYNAMYVNNQNLHRFVLGGGNLKAGTTYPTGFGFHFENGNVASYSYALYGIKD